MERNYEGTDKLFSLLKAGNLLLNLEKSVCRDVFMCQMSLFQTNFKWYFSTNKIACYYI